MPFDFAAAKAIARQAVHDTLGVRAFYSDDSVNNVEIKARWHNRISKSFGDLDGAGYSEIIEGIDRIIFNRVYVEGESSVVDAQGFPLQLKRAGLVEFEMLPGAVFELDTMEPITGPVEEVWMVSRK